MSFELSDPLHTSLTINYLSLTCQNQLNINESSTLRSGRVKNEQKRFLIKDRNNPSFSQWMDESDFKRFEKENKVNKDD